MQAPGHSHTTLSGVRGVIVAGVAGDTMTAVTGALSPFAHARLAKSPQEVLTLASREDPSLVVWVADGDFEAPVQLFQSLSERHPDVLRVLVCPADVDVRDPLRVAPNAHQVLWSKAPQLARMLVRVLELREFLRDAATRHLVLRSNQLPAAPATYRALQAELRDPRCSVLRVSRIIEGDLGVRARLLQLVSSAFLGLPRGASSVGGSIAYLGLRTVSALVLAAEVSNCFKFRPVPGFSPERLSERSLAAARIAKRVLAGTGLEEFGFVAALFHGVGQLVIAAREPARFQEALERSRQTGISQVEAEQAVLGTAHPLVGGYLLAAWGLPLVVAEAVVHQDHPELSDDQLGVTTAVYLSRRLAIDPAIPLNEAVLPGQAALDASYLQRVGALDKLQSLRDFARTSS
jgi:HD-like signal output (HDOD) protein